MRDAQSALDQVMAFAGQTITVEDVAAVLGLVGRDLLFEMIEAVIAEDGPRAFAAVDRAVESGYDLKLIVRELTKVVRDMMMVTVDPSRAGDGDLAEGELERLTSLARQFSREDLLRAFDVLARAEQDIRTASHPRYHIEMMLMRWMHLRKLVPLMELLEGGGAPARKLTPPAAAAPRRGAAKESAASSSEPSRATRSLVSSVKPAAPAGDPGPASGPVAPGGLKDKFLAELRAGKNTLYSLAVAQAQRIDVTDERITFTFASNQNVARMQLDANREWLEDVAHRLTGRRMQVVSVQMPGAAAPPAGVAAAAPAAPKRDLREEARSSPGIQAMLDVFPAEIRDVEEMT